MSKRMYILFYLCLTLFLTVGTSAVAQSSRDGGEDINGDMIVAPTLALRCGLDSPERRMMTEDCLNRLAYDQKTGKIEGFNFGSYEDLRRDILSSYLGAYMKNALDQLVKSSEHEDKVNKMVCLDNSETSCKNKSKDIRDEIEYNNELVTNNGSILLEAASLRAQEVNLMSFETMLSHIVPARDVDISDKSLATAP